MKEHNQPLEGFRWPHGLKRTKPREAVIAVLWESEKPLSARDIYGILEKNRVEKDGPPVWLSTVYRILEQLVEKDVVVKLTLLDQEMAVYELHQSSHRHYAVCVDCRKMVTIDNCPMERFEPQLEDDSFQVLGHRIEMYGYCKDCKQHHSK